MLLLCFLVYAMIGSAQSDQKIIVPAKVKDMLLLQFPNTLDQPASWSMEGKNYKATLKAFEAPACAVWDSLGNLIYKEQRLHEKYMPPKVKENLLKEYPDCTILMVFEKTDAKGNVTYKTKVQLKTDFLFDSKGNWIKESRPKP